MKKILSLLFICLSLLLVNVFTSIKTEASESKPSVNDLFNQYYNDGYYVKDTTIYLNESAINELTQLGCWHNDVSLLERTTYYRGDALWMSNHLGGYSYYGTSGNNMTHSYVSKVGETSNTVVIQGQTMEDYYYTLYDLSIYESISWTNTIGIYKSEDSRLIEMFKAITAPCYLGFEDDKTNNYITLSYVSVTVENGNLVLRLHSLSDYGKSTNNDVFSEAIIRGLGIETEAMERYQLNAHAIDSGLYLQASIFVDNYTIGNNWKNDNHIEMEIWQHNIGYGFGGTYFAFFTDGSYYVNNNSNIRNIANVVKVVTNPVGSEYKYEIIFNIYIEFDNNLENPQDGPYAYVQYMVYTPSEGVKGYEGAAMISKDNGDRILWTDHCSSYEVRAKGIISKAEEKTGYDATTYQTITTDAPERYEVYGYACDEGIVINAVQYVNNYSVGTNWLRDTHIEVKLYNHGIGYSWDGTYLAFFMDGSYYINNETNLTTMVNYVTVEESDGEYNYKITYKVLIGFANNLENPQDGPYAYLQFMSYTPGEDNTGYENAQQITQDGDRNLWKDKCESYRFARDGIVERMGV